MVRSGRARRRILPRWLSWPVVVATPLVVVVVGLEVASTPQVIPLALMPLAIVAPALIWLDRVHPQSWSTRIHALLWGSTVAVAVTAVVNTSAEEALGASVAAVAVAPMIEEATKGLGVVWAVRRGEIDGVMDGIVSAGWIGLGFTVVEDMLYYEITEKEGDLLQEFLTRGLLTPFAHSMLTFWTGLAVGIAVYRRKPLAWAIWGFAVAVAAHSVLNWTGEVDEEPFTALSVALLVALTVVVVVVAVRARRQEVARFVTGGPTVLDRYGPSSWDPEVVSSWSGMLAHRRQLPREQRREFDSERCAIARLALQESRPGGPDLDRQQELVSRLGRHTEGGTA
jgi:RsiW-degrading membrane proteinase PrsW (M82 family)